MLSKLLIILMLAGAVSAQNGTPIHKYKFYDTLAHDVNEDTIKVNRRRLTADIDSTGISMYAWGGECSFKINFVELMELFGNHYEIGELNGHPYLEIGNNNYRFKTYIDETGNLEFDAWLKKKPPNSQYWLTFNIKSVGLRWLWQDSVLITDDPFSEPFSPDVLNSYVVKHATKRNNVRRIDGSDTTFDAYGNGTAFTMRRPFAFDDGGDTVWANVFIDTIVDTMTVWVDSTWLANADFPVTIDPRLGYQTIGGTLTNLCGYVVWAEYLTIEAGTLDYIAFAGYATPDNIYQGGIYSDNGDNANQNGPVDSLETDGTGVIMSYNGGAAYWDSVSMGGYSMANATIYWLGTMIEAGTNCRIANDANPVSNQAGYETASVWPQPATDVAGTWDVDLSCYFVYTVTGGDEIENRRRQLLLKGN